MPGQFAGFGLELFPQLIELGCLVFEIAAGLLHLLVALINLAGTLVELMLPGFQRGFQAVEANEIVLMLCLLAGQRLLLLRQLGFAGLEVSLQVGGGRFQLRCTTDHQLVLLFELIAKPLLLGGLSVDLQHADLGFLLLGIDLLLPLLDFLRCTVTNIGHFPANRFQFLLAAFQILELLVTRGRSTSLRQGRRRWFLAGCVVVWRFGRAQKKLGGSDSYAVAIREGSAVGRLSVDE